MFWCRLERDLLDCSLVNYPALLFFNTRHEAGELTGSGKVMASLIRRNRWRSHRKMYVEPEELLSWASFMAFVSRYFMA
jgi:hypothetical protein